jgi:hypothetical protein
MICFVVFFAEVDTGFDVITQLERAGKLPDQ